MPYAIRKRGDRFVVVVRDTGRVLGTHPTRGKAEAQLRAVYADAPPAAERPGKGEG